MRRIEDHHVDRIGFHADSEARVGKGPLQRLAIDVAGVGVVYRVGDERVKAVVDSYLSSPLGPQRPAGTLEAETKGMS